MTSRNTDTSTNRSSHNESVDSRVGYLSGLIDIATTIHRTAPPLRRLKKVMVFSLNGLRYRRQLEQLQSVFDCAELAEVLKDFPAILEKPFDPYVCVDWQLNTRIEQIQNHFRFLKTDFGENTSKIYRPQSYQLFEFTANDDEVYSVQLFPGYQNEGSIGVRLCDDNGQEIYTLSFHLSDHSGRSCFIGALQGPNDDVPERQKTITMLTRSLHGLRPKSLLVESLYAITKSLKIESIYAVSNQGNIYQSAKYSNAKRAQVVFDFDQFWNEYHAKEHSPAFFTLPLEPVRKDIAQIKSKKRSLYRKRYALIDDLSMQIEDALNELMLVKRERFDETELDKAA